MKNSLRPSNDKPDYPPQEWQGWPLAPRPSDWLDRHTGCLLGLIIVVGSFFSFVCGVIVGLVQPPIYSWVLRLLGLG